MKVYIVVGSDYDGNDIGDVFLDKQLAEQNAKMRNKFKSVWDLHMQYHVVEKDLIDTPIKQNTDMLAIKISGYVMFDRTQELPKIDGVVAEDWCVGMFDDIGEDFISVDMYLKASVDDFDLSKEELTNKYVVVWEDVLKMANDMKDSGAELEDIALAIKDKYEVSWV